MARALFLSLPLTGHINPSLGLVRELVRRGDHVVYYATAPYRVRVEATGASFRRYRNSFLSDLREVPERLHELSWLLTRTVSEILENELEDFKAVRADYIITDSVAPWGQWVGEKLGIPVVTSVSTFAVNRHVLRYAALQGIRPKASSRFVEKLRFIVRSLLLARKLRQRHGVRGPGPTGLVMGRSGLNIVYTSKLMQPCGETFDNRFRFVGPSSAGREEASDFDWTAVKHTVLIYISLGTLFNADAAFYRHCLEAFRDVDCSVVMSVGTSVSLDDFGQLPPNFIVRSHVPQLEILQRATVFVTHGGMNSVSESLACGVPMVLIPQMSEQELVARRVAELGAGVRLAASEVCPDLIREKVQQVLTVASFRTAAATIRGSFEAAGGISEAADAVFAFTR